MANLTPPVTPAPGTATPEPQTPEPTTPQTPGQEQAATQEPKFVTIEELDRREAQLKLDLRKADKQRANQIKQELKALKDTLTASGVQVTPQVEANLQDQISLKYEEPDEQASTEADSLADIPPDWKNAIDMMAEAGVTIEKDTPEFDKHIKPLLSNPNPGPKLLLAVSQAINETQVRLNLHKDKAQLRVPGGSGTQAPGEVVATSAKDYLNAAYQKK